MKESKIACPKCGGHILVPKEIAGQVVACPHCGESILLPKSKFPVAWIVAGVLGFVIICLAGALFLLHKPQQTIKTVLIVDNSATPTTASQNNTGSKNQADGVEDSADVQGIKNVCKDFYSALNSQDTQGIQDLLPESCRSVLTTEDLKKIINPYWGNYQLISLVSAKFQDGATGKRATVMIKRSAQQSGRVEEVNRQYKFIKDANGWRIFLEDDLKDALASRFMKSGFSGDVKKIIQILRDGDPFTKWDQNDTNVLATVFKSSQGQSPVFPWDIQFKIVNNKVDKFSLAFDFTLKNNSTEIWESPYLEFQLKRAGKILFSGNALLSNIQPGQEAQGDTSFFIKDPLQDSAKFDLDVSYSMAGKQFSLVQNLPVDFKVQKLTESVKFDVVKKSFDITKSDNGDSMLVARVDYRVKNVGHDPLKQVQLKFVWSSLNGEVVDQTTEYVVGYGDLPLAPQQIKSGFVQCGKGYLDRRVPVKVDIYLEDDERHWPLIKGLLVQ